MKGFYLEVTGPYACFTRPEMKVERVSYDVMTPSAGRAIFEAILWKPAIRWVVKRIEVLAPIKWISVRRNEVGAVASRRRPGIFIEDERQQRAGLFLRDVSYRIHAEFEFVPPENRVERAGTSTRGIPEGQDGREARSHESEAKYAAMFERHATKGQCFNQPYLGCREFAASFRLVDEQREPSNPIPETRDLGWMLYDLDYSDPTDPKPMFFRAKMENGVIYVPERTDREAVRG
ncbi:MAG: type I-C CRISPR-associated protein Cas5 [Deltaproteobacteria bacterium]|nr:type I-C CRISPR-associated protein Cas5 [Deltaproteobacteria bacterium]